MTDRVLGRAIQGDYPTPSELAEIEQRKAEAKAEKDRKIAESDSAWHRNRRRNLDRCATGRIRTRRGKSVLEES